MPAGGMVFSLIFHFTITGTMRINTLVMFNILQIRNLIYFPTLLMLQMVLQELVHFRNPAQQILKFSRNYDAEISLTLTQETYEA
jgi:hypothetical protein